MEGEAAGLTLPVRWWMVKVWQSSERSATVPDYREAGPRELASSILLLSKIGAGSARATD